MNVSALKIGVNAASNTTSNTNSQTNSATTSANNDAVMNMVTSPVPDSATSKTEKRQVKPEEVQQMTAAMNQFTQAMNSNIQFVIHEKTKELMVQVVDQSNNKVLKEFPSHEFLDTVAAIRSYIGILLDKRI